MKASRIHKSLSPRSIASISLALSVAVFVQAGSCAPEPQKKDSSVKAAGTDLAVKADLKSTGNLQTTQIQTPSAKQQEPELVDQKASDQKAADDKAVDDKAVDQKASDPKAAEQKAEAEPTEDDMHDQGLFHWQISKRYFKEWDLDLAETELDLAVMSWPELVVAHRDLCLVSLLRLNIPRSVAEFMMTVGLGEAVPMDESESAKLTENAMVKHYKKGLLFARKQNWAQTANELQLAVNLVPDDYAVQRSLAYAYAHLGNFKKAEEHYRKTFELAPQDGSSRADLAYILAENGKLGEAQKELEAAVKSEPATAAYHVDLGWMAESRGDFETASRELQEALKLSPKHAFLWAHLARVLERKGEQAQAQDAYKQALAIDPKLNDARKSLDRLNSQKSSPI